MEKFDEIKNDYIDEDGFLHIDVWDHGKEEGRTVAVICKYSGKVYFIDNTVRNNRKIMQLIAAITPIPQKPRVLIHMEGGIIQWVAADRDMDILTVDEDLKDDGPVGDVHAPAVIKDPGKFFELYTSGEYMLNQYPGIAELIRKDIEKLKF